MTTNTNPPKPTPTQKRTQLLTFMAQGDNYDTAYTKAGLSDYGHNRAIYLKRLIDNGHLTIHPTNPPHTT